MVCFLPGLRTCHQFLYLVVNMMLLDYWKDIKGYEGLYSVSYCGGVRNLRRMAKHYRGGKRLVRDRILRLVWDNGGYLTVFLCDGNGQLRKRVHRLIAEAFIKNPNNYPQVNHKVPVKTINFACNLEWCTSSHNTLHAYKNGLIPSRKGENHPRSKLTNKEVINIKKLLNQNYTQSSIAQKYNINTHVVSDIKIGKTWSHICI